MNTKTPVSILQEMMVKNRTQVNYELIHDGGGSHKNLFTFQVSCNGLDATGTGRCKKDAKHEAAKAMLEKIATYQGLPQLPASPSISPARTPLVEPFPTRGIAPPNEPFCNAIGELQDLCSTNELQSPEYKEISGVGPPHARIFTVQCTIFSFKEEGVATTKKQAKHEAAKKMLAKMKEVVKDTSRDNLDGFTNNERNNVSEASEVAANRYGQCHETASKKVYWGLQIKDYTSHFKNSLDAEIREKLMEELKTLAKNLKANYNNFSETFIKTVQDEFQQLISTVNVEMKHMLMCTTDPSVYMLAMYLDTVPNIVELGMGSSKEEAEACTLVKVIDAMILLLN